MWNNNNEDSIRRTTGNAFGDVLLGGLVGGADSIQPKGMYVPMANWQGNGLARTGIQYLVNPNYRDYASGARMLSSIFGNNKNKKSNDEEIKPSDIFSNIFEDYTVSYPLKTTQYQMPKVGDVGGGSVGGYGNAYNSFYDYSLPVENTNFKLPWE